MNERYKTDDRIESSLKKLSGRGRITERNSTAGFADPNPGLRIPSAL
jgi:hypothetical protein